MDVTISHDPWAPDTDAEGNPIIEDEEVFAEQTSENPPPPEEPVNHADDPATVKALAEELPNDLVKAHDKEIKSVSK